MTAGRFLLLAVLASTAPVHAAASGAAMPSQPPVPAQEEHQHPPAPEDQHQHPPAPPSGADDHDHDHEPAALPPHVPPLTDADRAAAFPVLEEHPPHGGRMHAFLLVDRFEWQGGSGTSHGALAIDGWIGGDRDRVWFRVDGDGDRRGLDTAAVHALFGRAIAPWWDIVAGVRQDVRPGSAQTWASFGIQGLAPFWFEVAATGYLSTEGRTRLHLEGDYDLLVTNRLILQPHVEADLYGRSDPARGVGAGLAGAEWGVRLRYEIRRELAPYVGVLWHRTFAGTRDLRVDAGEAPGGTRMTAGLRFWF